MKRFILPILLSLFLVGCSVKPSIEEPQDPNIEENLEDDEDNTEGDNTGDNTEEDPNENEDNDTGDNENEGEPVDDNTGDEDNSDDTEDQNTDTDNDDTGGTNTDTDEGDTDEGDNTETVNTKTKKFTFTGNPDLETGDNKASNFKEKFETFLNKDESLVSSVLFDGYVQVNLFTSDENNTKTKFLSLGSNSESGKITFNFTVEVLSVKFNVQQFQKIWKPYDPDVINYSVDDGVKVCIDTNDNYIQLSEEYDWETICPAKDFSKDYVDGTNTVSVFNLEGYRRAFIHSMEITYKSE